MRAVRLAKTTLWFLLHPRETELLRYRLAEGLTGLIYPKYKFSDIARIYLEDDEFRREYERVEPDNYRSLDRKYTVDQLVNLVSRVEGDTAECGVFQGATSYFICRRIAGSAKRHHLFDSFQGLSAPGVNDGTYWKTGDMRGSEAKVRRNLKRFESQVVYHKGWIPERFSDVADARFSFLHLDVDLYQPTLDSLEFFYPRMNQNGIIVCDDYGFTTCPGARKAMNLFFSDKPERIVSLPTGQGFVVKLPPGLD